MRRTWPPHAWPSPHATLIRAALWQAGWAAGEAASALRTSSARRRPPTRCLDIVTGTLLGVGLGARAREIVEASMT